MPELALEAELTASYIEVLGAVSAILQHTRADREAAGMPALGRLVAAMELAGGRNVAAMRAWAAFWDMEEMRFDAAVKATVNTVAAIGDFCCWSLGMDPELALGREPGTGYAHDVVTAALSEGKARL